MFNLDQLNWQYDWQQGPKLFNLRIKVCRSCMDKPQESGRTIVLPPDPIPITYPLPENYALADSPLSPLGYNPASPFGLTSSAAALGSNIGNLINNGGLNAAFDSNSNKPADMSAALSVSVSSFQNFVGKSWNGYPSGVHISTPSTVAATTHVVSSMTMTAPNNFKFLNTAGAAGTGYQVQGSPEGVNWIVLASGTTAGTIGEVAAVTVSIGGAYPFHRVAIQGDGFSAIYCAQVALSVSDAAPNDV